MDKESSVKNRQQAIPALEPAIFVIFGITGDLAQKRLLPALYHLLKDNLLHEHTEIVGISRKEITPEKLLAGVELCVLEEDNVCDPATLERFRKALRMVQLDPVKKEDYDMLLTTLNGIETAHGMCMNRLYYLAIPPQVYEPVIQNLGVCGLQKGCQHHRAVSRLLVEKPFGYDLTSAEDLIKNTGRYFHEDQVFRIDHYLAKETVQNILFFRKHNPVFASLWDHEHISAIDIEMLERLDVKGRGEFYDNVGALRDVVQNHLMQLLALVTLELPAESADSLTLHKAKQVLLNAVQPIDMRKHAALRAQYVGYREAVGNLHSTTETYVRVRLDIANNRWQGVPITITAGKAMETKRTAITVTFVSADMPRMRNKLTFRLQPNEGIDIELTAKRPGYENKTEIVQMDFSYRGVLGNAEHPDAYERVLVDAVRGDHSLFATSQEILAAWRVLQPALDSWQQSSEDLLTYELGSNGPTT
jgi:glucose-6-phosphate 1-dehydrogenase